MPFRGPEARLRELLETLACVELRPDDELIVADNQTTDPKPRTEGLVLIHPAGGVHSPGFARNRGAAVASREWLVFIDADTIPIPKLLDAYFDPPPGPQTAILAGGIRDILRPGEPTTLAARHLVTRGQMSQNVTTGRQTFPYAQTANCAIRRSAFAPVGGFEEGILAGEDADLCFRLEAAGWELESRDAAVVDHVARGTLGESLRQLARHGSGAAWCEERHPGSFPRPRPTELTRRLGAGALRAAKARAAGDREAAAFALLDVAEASAFEFGRLLPNRVRR